MNYYERHLGDYAKDTANLSQGQVGAYDLLLDYYYATEAPLPAEKDELYAITRARDSAERKNTDKVLSKFFKLTDEGYVKGRVEEEIARYRAKCEKAAASANKRWGRCERISERNANAYANALPTHDERICVSHAHHTPDTNKKQKQKIAPSGVNFGEVSPQVVADFTAHRKAMRAPITQTALDGIRREATKAGMSLESALAMSCARGWRGFKAEWVDEGRARAGPAAAPGKTMTAIQKLEAMKHGLADNGNSDGLPETPLLGFGANAG